MREITSDVLIIGSEAAGGTSAIEAASAGCSVLLVTKGTHGRSGATEMAVYSCNAALGLADQRDSPDVHFRDVVVGGEFLSDQRLVEMFVTNAPERVLELERYGLRWDRKDGRIEQGFIPGCTYPRSVHIGRITGLRMARAIRAEVLKHEQIRVIDDTFVTDLLLSTRGEVVGAIGVELEHGGLVVFRSRATILATGGGGYIYQRYIGSSESTGDGYAAAYRAGAELVDMEFVQFFLAAAYPPSLEGTEGPITPYYWSSPKLYNSLGERFMRRYAPKEMERATRDILSRAIATEIKRGRGTPHEGVWFDISYLPPNITEAQVQEVFGGSWTWSGIPMLEYDLDPREKALEICTGALYFVGGIRIDEKCRTNVPGLLAAGEAAGGILGANRIGGDALSLCLVTGAVAGQQAAQLALSQDSAAAPDALWLEGRSRQILAPFASREGESPISKRRRLQTTMWECAGVLRDAAGLRRGLAEIEELRSSPVVLASATRRYNKEWIEALALENMAVVAEMVCKAALARAETRGCHSREDFPLMDNANWLKNIVIGKSGPGMVLSTVPPVTTRMRPEATQ